MSHLLFFLIIVITQITRNSGMDTCVPDANVAVYEELKCTPLTDKSKSCIASYDCNFLFKSDKTKCYYQGIEFSVGESLIDSSNGTCYPICKCENITEEAQFLCSKIQCEEIYSGNNSCMYTYSSNECCAVLQFCGGEQEIAKKDLPMCEIGNRTMYEGEYMAFANCKKCLCTADFEIETFDAEACERIPCEIERNNGRDIQNFCAPVFFRDYKCCPRFWYCSTGNENVTTDDTIKTFTDEKCMFGEWLLETNQKLTIEGHQSYTYCITCACVVPPFLTCIVNENCEYNTLYGIIEDRSRRSFRRKIDRTHGTGEYYNYHL